MQSVTSEARPSKPQDNGWVRVRRRKGRPLPAPAQADNSLSSVPIPSIPSLSLEQVKQDHERFARQWKSSPSNFQLQELLFAPIASGAVTKAICFGLGTFDPADGAWEQKRKTHVQLAAFLTIVEHIENKASRQIRCFFQDPIFNSVDRAFIESLGHEVVESPAGFHLVDSSALVFGIHLYRDVYSQAIAKHIPAIFIGTPYDIWEDCHGTENLDWARMKDLDRICAKVRFPEITDFTFCSTAIHWRQRDQS
ncbi:hypothetical protein F5Y19DRAFT_399518 [Xylariaceae sp. FL1651]|nr:hypothetical protein F5Y19DRAFT_399518 [Xylariaceae sp. FL1651]